MIEKYYTEKITIQREQVKVATDGENIKTWQDHIKNHPANVQGKGGRHLVIDNRKVFVSLYNVFCSIADITEDDRVCWKNKKFTINQVNPLNNHHIEFEMEDIT